MKLIRYKLTRDAVTTHWLREPYDSDGERLVEDLGELRDGYRYVIVPDGVTLPAQPHATVEDVEVTDQVKQRIAADSPHAQLLAKRAADKPAVVLPKQDVIRSERLREVMETPENRQQIADWIRDHVGEWQVGEAVEAKVLRSFDGILYESIKAHTTQADWTPPVATSLWTPVVPPHVIPQWSPRTGAHDAYGLGDKVLHNGKTWVSNHPANVWEPGATGITTWDEVR